MPRKAPGSALIGFDLRVTGDKEAAALFNAVGSRVRARVSDAIGEISAAVKAQGVAEIAALTKTGTGRLASGLVISRRETPTNISELVFHNNRHFYILSYGSPKHETWVNRQRNKAADIKGWRIKLKNGKARRYRYIVIRGYTGGFKRKVNLKARPFLARAWNAIGGASRAEATIAAAVALGVSESRTAASPSTPGRSPAPAEARV
jgi:hypothetical protein